MQENKTMFTKPLFSPNPALAIAYVPWQNWEEPYDADTGFERGTLFPSLDKPFIGEEAITNAYK